MHVDGPDLDLHVSSQSPSGPAGALHGLPFRFRPVHLFVIHELFMVKKFKGPRIPREPMLGRHSGTQAHLLVAVWIELECVC